MVFIVSHIVCLLLIIMFAFASKSFMSIVYFAFAFPLVMKLNEFF